MQEFCDPELAGYTFNSSKWENVFPLRDSVCEVYDASKSHVEVGYTEHWQVTY